MPLFGIFSKKKKEDKKDTPAKQAKPTEQRKQPEKAKREQDNVGASTNYKPPNLFDGMQLNSVPDPKPPPPNPGVENLKSFNSEPMTFGFLVGNNAPEQPVVEEKPITGKDIFQGLNTIVPDLQVSPFSLKDAKAREQDPNNSLTISNTQPTNTSVSNPSAFDLMDLLSDQPFKQPSQSQPPQFPKPPSESESKTTPEKPVQESSPQLQKMESGGSVQSSHRNSLQGLRRKGDGVTYKWSLDLINQKQDQPGAMQEEDSKKIPETFSNEGGSFKFMKEQPIKKNPEQRPKTQVKSETKKEILRKVPEKSEQMRDLRGRGKQQNQHQQQVQYQQPSFPTSMVQEVDFGKLNSIEEVQKGLKSYKKELIKVTLEQHEITQKLDEWKKKIENKEETLKLAIEKENQLVAQEMFEEGEKVKEMVDALKNQLDTMNQALKTLEKDYNQKEFAKTEIVDKMISKLGKSRDHFESKLDYSKGRLLTWESNEKKKLISKEHDGEVKVQELETLEEQLSQTKNQLDHEQHSLQEKIKENTKDIVKRREDVREELQSVDAKIEQLNREIEKLKGIREGLEENEKECDRAIQKEQARFSEDLEVIGSLKISITKDEARVNALYEEIAEIQEQTESLQTKIAQYREESEQKIGIWEKNFQGTQEMVQKYQADNSRRLKIIHGISSISEKLKLLEGEEKECKEMLENSKSKVSDLEIEIDDLKKELETLGHKLQTAETNKKKMAAARQFNKAAVHVKEIKQFKEQSGDTEQKLDQKQSWMKEQNKLIDELSLKLPSLTNQSGQLGLQLKKSKKTFLEIRLNELEEIKDILSNQSQTPDFKKLNVIREEKQSTEQELMRIKAVLQISQSMEEIKQEEPDLPPEEPIELEEQEVNRETGQQEVVQEEVVDVQARIKELQEKIDRNQEKIITASENQDYEQAARLEDQKLEMLNELKRLGGAVTEGQQEEGEREEIDLEAKQPEEGMETKEEHLGEEISEGNALKQEFESEEAKFNDKPEEANCKDNQLTNEQAKEEIKQDLAQNQEKTLGEEEVQNDEKQSLQDENQQSEEEEELMVKLEEPKHETTNSEKSISQVVQQQKQPDMQEEQDKREEDIQKELKEAEPEETQKKEEKESDPEESENKKESEMKQEKESEPQPSEKEQQSEPESLGLSLGGGGGGGGGGLFSGMSFK